jgi:hypothetical protein
VGLFHLFIPLPSYYRQHIGRFFILPLLPGGPIAMTIDWYTHGRIVPRVFDQILIAVITLSINCGLFALVIAVVLRAVRIRQNSWRTNANTFD